MNTIKDTTENNKLIAEFMGYKVHSDGTIIGKHNKPLKLHTGSGDYLQVNLYSKGKPKTFLLHRLLALLFIPNSKNKSEVNHKDGNKLNNSLSNLEWVSRSENINHGIENNLIPAPWKNKKGKEHVRSKTTLQLTLEGEIINEFGSAREASRKTGINYGTISNVLIERGNTAGGYKWKYKN